MKIRKLIMILAVIMLPVAMFCQDELTPKCVEIREAVASSTLEAKYSAKNLANYSYESWVEGSSGDGTGEWIELFFSEPTPINGISIKNGFGNLAYYWKNNRVKTATIIFDDDESTETQVELEDTPQAQFIYFGLLDETYSKMRLTIDEVYPGTFEDNDCCIDEICVNAGIGREYIYDTYSESQENAYLYDPETKRMLRGLYEIDVGKDKVKENDKGFLLVEESDWEMGFTYWVQVNPSLRGRMIHGYWPGTGGGHESNQYKIYLNPNGRHLLFTWHEEFYGYWEYYDPEVTLYVWENQTWKESEDWNVKGFEPVRNLKNLLESRNIEFYFDIAGEYSDYDGMEFTAYFKSDPYFSVKFRFTEENCVFSDYEKTLWNVAAFGSPDDFTKNPALVAELENFSDKTENPLIVASAFNPDPKMAEYLIEKRFSLTTEKDYYRKNYSALEAWNLGSNNKAVRDVLLKHGAEYSQKMLIDCVEKDDRESFKEFEPFISSYDEVVKDLNNRIDYLNTEEMEFYFRELNKLGVDIGTESVSEAIEAGNIELTKFLLSLGCEIPEHLNNYGSSSPLEYHAEEYIEYSQYRDEEYSESWKEQWDEHAKRAWNFMEYLFSLGVSANGTDGSGENILQSMAGNGDYLNKYHIEMAKLFIENGADVNNVGEYDNGNHPLTRFLREVGFDEKYWSDEQKEFKKLLLDNGAYPEYGLLALFWNNTPSELFEAGSPLNKAFNEYFSKSTGKNVLCGHRSYLDTIDEKSLIIWLLETYWTDKRYRYDDMLIKLLNAGFSADGYVLYNDAIDPIVYYMEHLKEGSFDDKSLYIIQKMFEVRQEKSNPSQIMYKLIRDSMGSFFDDHLPEIVKVLLDNGADWSYSQSEKLNDNKITSCAELLLHPARKSEIQYSEDEYIETARILIEAGAGDVLTEEAFKAAKTPSKVYKAILE